MSENRTEDINEILASDYTYCDKCKKYYPNKEYEIVEKEEIKRKCTFCDGDDYEYSDIKYIVTYKVCKICNSNSKLREERKNTISSFIGNYYED